MPELYRWFRKRMSLFHRETVGDTRRTVRREVIVQTEERTLLLRSTHGNDAAYCPLCGQPMIPATGNRSSGHFTERKNRDLTGDRE